ncbi:MAG: MOSC domain-containing protein [Thermoleophilaceae bacterium]|jgi:MOSC domain-containing protein YiiM|nr:MOSC domain-containing protein [Thermoleophilaceae bacterium]
MAGTVLSVNVGRARKVQHRGRAVPTGIWKAPVEGRVAASATSLDGDEQGDRAGHGGPDQAVYAYAREDYAWWEKELDRALAPGTFGENLTLRGVDVSGARIGERWTIGTTVLEVSSARTPCWKLGLRMDDPGFVKRFGAAGRPGAYLRVVCEGELAAGDGVALVWRPPHNVDMALMSRVCLHDHSRAGELLEADALPGRWRRWAQRRAA